MCVLLSDFLTDVLYFIEKIFRLISTGMSNIYHQEQRCQNFDFLGKKIWRNAVALKSKKVQGIFGETFILTLLSSAVFLLQNHPLDFF